MNVPNIQTGDFSPSREEFCRLCHLLYERHLASGVGGNVAVRCGNRIWLTPAGCSLRNVQPSILSVVDLKGRLIEGTPPTKEADMHLGIFRSRPEVNVVFHLHGPYIVAASTLFDPGPSTLPALTPGFVYFAFPLPMLPFAVPGTPELAEGVAQALSRQATSAVLLQNHGLVTAGKDFCEALNIAEEIDEAARVYVVTRGKAPSISREDTERIRAIRRV